MSVVPLRWYELNVQWFVLAVGYYLWMLRVFKYAAVFRYLNTRPLDQDIRLIITL